MYTEESISEDSNEQFESTLNENIVPPEEMKLNKAKETLERIRS